MEGACGSKIGNKLGHSRPSITTDCYQHLLEGMQGSAAERMQQVLGQTPKSPPAHA